MTTTTADDPFAAQRALVETLDKSGWDLIVGDAFVRGMRDIGYKSTSYALAELIDCPLVTCDARLARAPGIACPVEVFA